MILKPIAKNQTELTIKDKLIIFYSYETPVAFIDYRNMGYNSGKTNQFYSQTTTKHINGFFKRHGFLSDKIDQVPQSDIDQLLKYNNNGKKILFKFK